MDSRTLPLSRRRFMKATAFAGSAAALAACTPTGGGATSPPRSSAAPPPTPPTPLASVTSPNPTPDSAATVLVKDVVEFELHGPYQWNGGSVTLRLHEGRLDGESAEAVDAAVAAGRLAVEETEIVVNYPTVKWPAGELPVDTVVEKALEGGPLLGPPDLATMTATFKLHQCFPESRYIVTDTSAVPMAPMMNIQGSPGTTGLAELGAASTITVFGNGLNGPGAMGFQPGIFREKAGLPSWSPLWDHFTAVWMDPSKAVLLGSQAELDERVAAGEIEIFKGTPDTGGQGFVVNCPSPIVAPNDFEVTS